MTTHKDAIARTSRNDPQSSTPESDAPGLVPEALRPWGSAAVAGGIAGVLFGAVMPAEEMMPMVAMLYGVEGVVAGWALHLVHSMVFGVALAVVASRALPGITRDVASAAVLGAAYGLVLWVIFAAVVMPLWIGAVTDMEPPVPDWNWLSFVGHAVYGAGLGALLATFPRTAR